MYVNRDPGCYRAIDADMALGGSLGPHDALAPGGATGHTYQYGLCDGVVLPDSIQAAGCGPDPGPLYGLWWQPVPQISTF